MTDTADNQPDPLTMNHEGLQNGSGVSVILENTEKVGAGPRLHQHPYPETFIILRGSALFTIAGEERVGSAGQVLVVPANTPHKFKVLGPGFYQGVHIHESEEFATEWLE